MQAAGVLIFLYRNAALRQNRTRIEARIHFHDRYAGLAIAFEKRALDGRRAAPARQERCMDIQSSMRWNVEDRWRQEHAVSDDHHDIGARGADTCRGVR